MLQPSSSEEESDNEVSAPAPAGLAASLRTRQIVAEEESLHFGSQSGSVDQRSLSAVSRGSGGSGDNVSLSGTTSGGSSNQMLYSSGGTVARPSSPSPSLVSSTVDGVNMVGRESEIDRSEREEEERRKRLQLYVFVMRCIAYPFNAKQPTDMLRRQAKVTKQQLQSVKERFQLFLNGELNIPADEAFINAIQSYIDVFLKSDRVVAMIHHGGCSMGDFRDVFKNNIERRIQSLPDIAGLPKETVINSWMSKFDQILRGNEDPRKWSQQRQAATSEAILSKEQLFEMFQSITNVKKYEHQILYNAMQLDSGDEQAAQVRRELDSRLQVTEAMIQKTQPCPTFVVKEMESTYIEELQSTVSLLMANLESVPVSKGSSSGESKYSLNKFKRYTKPIHAGISKVDMSEDGDHSLSKVDVVLTFAIEVIVMEVKGLKSLPANKIVYCTMEVDGGDKLQTDQAEASKPCWDTQGDFTTNIPLPMVKVKLFTENSSLLSLDDRELGRVILMPTAATPKTPEWYDLQTSKHCPDKNLKIRIQLRIDKPQNMKHCGFLFTLGRTVWKKWKKRYCILVQVSQYTFALCSYRERKADPTEMLQLDSFTVDYCEPIEGVEGARFYFNTVREGDQVIFGTEDETERTLWVQAIYRATGQSHKPVAPTNQPSRVANTQLSKEKGDADKARKHGLDEFVQANPSKFCHREFFAVLQRMTLEYRLNDQFTCLGWFSPGQVFVLDEYCARYGVRGCQRHLSYLNDLLTSAERGTMIDPTLMHYSFAFCASHVHGHRPDGIGTVLREEWDKFLEIKDRIRQLLEHQITNYRYSFPFGRPEGALKATLSLLERTLMKDLVTPVPVDEIQAVIKSCLEKAALINYTKMSELAKIEDAYQDEEYKKRLDSLLHLAELCVDVLRQNDEYYTDAFEWFGDVMAEHAEMLWSLYGVDMDALIDMQPPDTWDSFPLFQLLNDYLRMQEKLCNGPFHSHLRDVFAPQVVRYIDLMESSIAQSIHNGFEKETWKGQGNGCATSEDILWKLEALQSFIVDLHWPDEVFAEHISQRLTTLSTEMVEAAAKRTLTAFEVWIKKGTRGTDYVFPSEVLVMMNVIVDFKNQHRYAEIEYLDNVQTDMKCALMERLLSVLETTLNKLARYDQTSLFSSILSLTKPTDELGRSYVSFMRVSLDQIRQKVADELYILTLFEMWYIAQMKMVCDWLSERLDITLHPYQLTCLSSIIRKCYSDFELQGVAETVLKCKTYQTISSRLQVEEATQSVSQTESSSRAADDSERGRGPAAIASGMMMKFLGNGSAQND